MTFISKYQKRLTAPHAQIEECIAVSAVILGVIGDMI